MFDFIFKRPAGNPPSKEAPDMAQEPDSSADVAAAKNAAVTQAGTLAGNEPAAVEFILQCEYADARFKAAHHIHSRQLLEQVIQAIRNTDRRVAKLMQRRLEVILLQEKTERQADECIAQAQRLIEAPSLMPNHVADLDRAWAAIADSEQPMRDAFDRVRAVLRERLEAQAALQRAVIDVRTKLQKLTRAATEASHVFTPERLLQSLESLEQEMAQYYADREAQTLPQHLLSEFEKQRDHFRQTLVSVEKRHEAMAAGEAALAGWEEMSPAILKEDELQRVWRALPALVQAEAALEARFDALLVRIGEVRKAKDGASKNVEQGHRQYFTQALDSMEKALESGALQVAADQHKALRSIDSNKASPSNAQTARLAKARGELQRLQGWARWGGNISREELLKAAEELPAKSHPVAELAKKVGSLRERWKSLDISAGPASKELWERFDTACTAAYEPAAAHFKKLAEERHANLEKARSIITEVKQFAAKSNCADGDPDGVDWRAVAVFSAKTSQLWQRLGPIDRKDKKSADTEFETAMRLLSGPLAVRREVEITHREKLIVEASGLNPADRRTTDALRALQERWQECAKSLPLERKDEQALWQRFRNACDAVFAKRKEAANAADADRRLHLREKEALCATLEALEKEQSEVLPKKMREAAEAWSRIGPVPRSSEQQIEKRYRSALAILEKRVNDVQRSAKEAQVTALRDKLKLCRAIEQLIANDRAADDAELMQIQAEWQTVPELAGALERALRTRFELAMAALKTADRQHAALLQRNRAVLERDVLRLEIIMGIESPPELSRERLQLQVEVLQSSLKAGQRPPSRQELLLQLCGLSALTDHLLDSRIERVAARMDGGKS
ncbi:MAG: hypothetical protein A3I66_17405 [Burkholderiales bacterium RIFCSPLOWO2_02_FULL_57_36]|nr:MAG: hypothetical protein A3I66_17405 [Burkholderiales bacterium RIFCSPLOWO2_02_FULL_57_36]